MEQLKTDLTSIDIDLSDDVLAGIEDIHKLYTYPCP